MTINLLNNIVAFAANYFIHSTLLLTFALLLTRKFPPHLDAARETCLRLAFFAPILTAFLQTTCLAAPPWSVALSPAAPTVDQFASRSQASTFLENRSSNQPRPGKHDGGKASTDDDLNENRDERPESDHPPASHDADQPGHIATTPALPLPSDRQPPNAPLSSLADTSTPVGPSTNNLLSLRNPFVITLITLTTLSLITLFVRRRHLFHHLANRTFIPKGPVHAILADLAAQTRLPSLKSIRLTSSKSLRSPIALAVPRPEICIPIHLIENMPPDRLRAILAHEIAHLRRHDPFFMTLTHVVQYLFWFQPLNILARRQLIQLAEYQCDRFAATHTASPFSVAHCLTDLAEHITADHLPIRAVIPTMVAGKSTLAHRIHRLVNITPRARRLLSTSVIALAFSLITLVAFFAPAIHADAPRKPAKPNPSSEQKPGESKTFKFVDDPRFAIQLLNKEITQLSAELTRLITALDNTDLPNARKRQIRFVLEAKLKSIKARKAYLQRLVRKQHP